MSSPDRSLCTDFYESLIVSVCEDDSNSNGGLAVWVDRLLSL